MAYFTSPRTNFHFFYYDLYFRGFFVTLCFITCFIISFFYADVILFVLVCPLAEIIGSETGGNTQTITFLGIADLFFCQISLSFFASGLSTLPFIFFHSYLFFRAGLSRFERVVFVFVLLVSYGGLTLGLFLCIKFILPRAFVFFLTFLPMGSPVSFSFLPTLEPYMGIVLSFAYALIFSFQTPMIFFLLLFWGFLDFKWFILFRRWIFFILCFFSALLSPPDCSTQLMVFFPLAFFYEIFLFFSIFFFYMKDQFYFLKKRSFLFLGLIFALFFVFLLVVAARKSIFIRNKSMSYKMQGKFVHQSLLKKLFKGKGPISTSLGKLGTKKKAVLSLGKTWSRSSLILPDFIGYTVEVHNGKGFIPVKIDSSMVGFKLGEFSLTRAIKRRSSMKKRKKK